MTPPATSVVIVSRERPRALTRCLAALRQIDHPALEVIVAADAPGRDAVRAAGLARRVKVVAVDAPGIGAARNAGLAAAAAPVAAFIDDDAVPEPSWLAHLSAALAEGPAIAAGGFVRGANGIDYQYRARSIDTGLRHRDLTVPGDAPFRPDPGAGRAVRTEGTNMAVRREALIAHGGFDPAYVYYLDETDLNMRLARAGEITVIVPRAEIHHLMAPSRLRAGDRAPRSLFEIGASVAIFTGRHTPEGARPAAEAQARADARRSVLRQLVRGGVEPRDVARLMNSFEAGLTAGRARPAHQAVQFPAPPPFLPFPGAPGRSQSALAGRVWRAGTWRRRAGAAAATGGPVTLFLFSPSARPHRMRFRESGIWEQSGGLFGRAGRGDRRFRLISFSGRVAAEISRLARIRPLHLGPGGHSGGNSAP